MTLVFRTSLFVLVSLLASASTGYAGDTIHALLIGVTDYPGLPQKSQLIGPTQDVAMFRSLLSGAPFAVPEENIVVLAESQPSNIIYIIG